MSSDNNSKNKEQVIYRAFSLGRKRQSKAYDEFIYDTADLYELHAVRYPLRKNNYRWHLRNPLDRPIVTVGDDDWIVQLTAAKYFSEKSIATGGSGDYMLVVTKLIKRRFRSALQFDIDQYKAENSNTSSSNDDDSNVIQIMNITYEVLDFGAMLDDDYIRAAALEELELEKKEAQEKKEKKNPLNP